MAPAQLSSESPEVFITDDNIINTQENAGMEVDADVTTNVDHNSKKQLFLTLQSQ